MKELINNKEQLKAYIEYPRKQNTLPLIPPKEQPKLPFDDYGKPKPEKINEKTPELNKEENEKQDIAAIHFDKMKSGMAYIEKMMDKIENDNEQITWHIEFAKRERKEFNKMDGYPLERLQGMLEEWDNQEITTKDEIMDYAHELWKTASQFEKELK